MNIFAVDPDPARAARYLVDKHVIKMVLESAQLLSTAHRVLDGTQIILGEKRKRKYWVLDDPRELFLYNSTHINHPSSVWTRECSDNYYWLLLHFKALLAEYSYRYDKIHKCTSLVPYLESEPNTISDKSFTSFACAMPDEFIISVDPVTNYRNYYVNGKRHLAHWTNRKRPYWYGEDLSI